MKKQTVARVELERKKNGWLVSVYPDVVDDDGNLNGDEYVYTDTRAMLAFISAQLGMGLSEVSK